MRFSLMTLLLLALCAGAGMGVWFRRDPWMLEHFESRTYPEHMTYPGILAEKHAMPDGRREIGPYSEVTNQWPYGIQKEPFYDVVYDTKAKRVIYRFVDVDMHSNTVVIHSDDAFEVQASVIRKIADGTKTEFGLLKYRRRFPEWWWGQFLRLEVWIFGITFLILLFRAVQALTQDPPPETEPPKTAEPQT